MDKIIFPNFSSAAMYECEFEGQISDGKYEDISWLVDEMYEAPYPGSVWYEDDDEEENAWDEYYAFESKLNGHWRWINTVEVEINPNEKPHNTNVPYSHQLEYEFSEWIDAVRHFLNPQKYPDYDKDYAWAVRVYYYAKAAKAWQMRLNYDLRYMIETIGDKKITNIADLNNEKNLISQKMLDKFWATSYTLEEFEQDYHSALKAMNVSERVNF